MARGVVRSALLLRRCATAAAAVAAATALTAGSAAADGATAAAIAPADGACTHHDLLAELGGEDQGWPAWRVHHHHHHHHHHHGGDDGDHDDDPARRGDISVFGVVHHQLHVARQCARYIRAARPDAVVFEQPPRGLHRRVEAYETLLRTGRRGLRDMWRGATATGDAMGTAAASPRTARRRFRHGFDALCCEDFLAFAAMEAVGLCVARDAVAGGLPRGDVLRVCAASANGGAAAERRWLDANERWNPNVRQAYQFAERTLVEYEAAKVNKAVEDDDDDDDDDDAADLARRRAQYNGFFDIPDNVTYAGRFPRPPVTRAREGRLARAAWSAARGGRRVVVVCGADHGDGIMHVLSELEAEVHHRS